MDEKIFYEISGKYGNPESLLQKNVIYKFDNGLLRVRSENGKSFLTAKGKRLDDKFNSRPEIESELPADFFSQFESLGLGSPIYYEKYRASFTLNDCTICLDNLDGRYFVEIEGNEKEIIKNMTVLGLQDLPREKRSYLEIIKDKKLTRWAKCPRGLNLQPGSPKCMSCEDFVNREYKNLGDEGVYVTTCRRDTDGLKD